MGKVRSVVGTEWSMTAKVRSGRRTLRLSARRPAKACGEVPLLDEMTVDVDERRPAGLFVNDVAVPDLFVESLGRHGFTV